MVVFLGEIQVLDAQCDVVAHAGFSVIRIAEIEGLEDLRVWLQRVLRRVGERQASV